MCCMCGPPPGVSDDLPDNVEVDSEGVDVCCMCGPPPGVSPGWCRPVSRLYWPRLTGVPHQSHSAPQ